MYCWYNLLATVRCVLLKGSIEPAEGEPDNPHFHQQIVADNLKRYAEMGINKNVFMSCEFEVLL